MERKAIYLMKNAFLQAQKAEKIQDKKSFCYKFSYHFQKGESTSNSYGDRL